MYLYVANTYDSIFRIPQLPGVELITPEDVACFSNRSRNDSVNFDMRCEGVDFDRVVQRGDVSFIINNFAC